MGGEGRGGVGGGGGGAKKLTLSRHHYSTNQPFPDLLLLS